MRTISIHCPVCEQKNKWEMLLQSNDATHALYKCPDCGLRTLYPQPTENIMQGMYEDLSQKYDDEKNRMAIESSKYYSILIKKCMENTPERVNLLDIGSGLGYYTNSFGLLGIESTYIDADSVSYEFAKNNHKYIRNMYCMDVDEYLKTAEDTYDIIFCRHFIEHSFDPEKFMQLLYGVLKDDGIIVLETDNNNSDEMLTHKEAKKYWLKYYLENYKIDNIAHLKELKVTALGVKNTHWWAFTQENLSRLAHKLGYRIAYSRQYFLGDHFLWPNMSSDPPLEGEGAGLLFVLAKA